MKTLLSRLLVAVPLFILTRQVVPADVAPPPEQTAALTLGMLAVLCLIVAIVIAISVVVIRAIRKSYARKEDA